MRRSKTSLAIYVMTAILMSASLVPAQIRAEEGISEKPEVIEVTIPTEEETKVATEDELCEEDPESEFDAEEIEREEEMFHDSELTIMDKSDKAVTYYDRNGTRNECTDYQFLSDVVDQEGATLNGGWYVAEGAGWGFNNRVTISGEVNIILTDDCSVIFNRGIQNNTYGNLTIWGQYWGNGQITCIQAFETSGGNAGIGGDNGTSGGIFNLYGGKVTAVGQDYGAGIGGGKNGDGGTINIYGGTVNATGGNGLFVAGAGIGGGDEVDGGTITISGGNITATGANWAAGIGGGNCGNGGTITINGGKVRADGFKGGAGIGGGDDGDSGFITLNSAGVEAHGYLAIGHGDGGNNQSITMASGIGIEGLPYESRVSALNYARDVLLVNMDYADQTINYTDENGTQHECTDFQLLSDVIDRQGATLTDGWYVVKGAG